MKTKSIVSLLFLLTATAQAESYTILHTFGTNVMGLHPAAPVVQGADGSLYGTTQDGGGANRGQVFKVNPDGTGYTVLKDFLGTDGAGPVAGLVVSGTNLYGTTAFGGASGYGVVFKLSTDGSGYTVLKHFALTNGGNLWTALLLSGTTLYGTAYGGGSHDRGTIFKLNTDGSGFAVLKEFDGADDGGGVASLLLSGDTLYGTTYLDGVFYNGTLFKIQTDGSGFSVLKPFTGDDVASPQVGVIGPDMKIYGAGGASVFSINTDGTDFAILKQFTNALEGQNLNGGLALAGSTLYGTAIYGDSENGGTVFKLNTDGSDFAVLVDFSNGTNGYNPQAGLIVSGTTLLGTTTYGGADGYGTVFKLQTDGSDFAVVTHFAGGDGAEPYGLLLSGTNLYGTTRDGGGYAGGTIFRIGTNGSGYTLLRDFTNDLYGYTPDQLLLSGNTLFLPVIYGGSNYSGAIASMNTDGSDFTVLHSFADWNGSSAFTNEDGMWPQGKMVVLDATLYGTANQGGIYGAGTLFKVNTNGTGFSVLKQFSGNDGRYPSGLILAGTTLYGTTSRGGSSNENGTVFKFSTDGTGYTLLKEFTWIEGDSPEGLLLSGTTLYGACPSGGASSYGTLFKLETDGSDFVVLKTFNDNNAQQPHGPLVFLDGVAYGAASQGGVGGNGALFQINPDGSGFVVLKYFTDSDGRQPSATLVPSGTTLYGATPWGGALDSGVLFSFSPGPPTVASYPQSLTNNAGDAVELTFTAAGYPPPISYQWFLNSTNLIAGATTTTLDLTNLHFPDGGAYSVVLCNGHGCVTSLVATLTVNDPFITSQPLGQTVNPGQTALFSVEAIGTGPFSYQWRKGGVGLSGATSSTFSLSNAQLADIAMYDVVVGNAYSSVVSAPALLTVNLATVDALNPPSSWTLSYTTVNALALQPGGKILVGGTFYLGSGTPIYFNYANLARISPDGTLDTTFTPNYPSPVRVPPVNALAVQTDGGILVGGNPGLVRLNPDGTFDPNFNAQANNNVQCLAIQPDGKILVGGWFSNLGGQTRNCLGRLNADGTLDAAFDPGGFQRVNSLVVQADGKILVGQDQDGNGIVRLNPDGTFDMTFNPIARYSVRMIALQRDGKILVAGRLIHLAGKPMRGIGRLNADGTFDPTFDASVQGEIRIIAVLPSGRILVGGDLSLVDDQPRSELARLNCDGSLDATFGPAADQSVECFLPQSDGHILVGGYFTMIAGQSRTNFARLIAPESPVVTVSPPAMTAERASSATFTAKAATYPPANYQWLFNGAPLGGATNAALQLTDLQFAQAGAYSVVASNFAGLGVSSSCLLQVIPAVDRRPVPALLVGGEAGNFIHLEYAASPATPAWLPLETATLTSTQFVFDISSPMSSARFYRAWQTNVQSAKPSLQILGLVTKLTLTGSIGSNVRIDYIAQFGPTDAWVNLDTVTLTNTSQPYFDLTMLHQPARLYRLVPVP